jgi:hypothetical protein
MRCTTQALTSVNVIIGRPSIFSAPGHYTSLPGELGCIRRWGQMHFSREAAKNAKKSEFHRRRILLKRRDEKS